MASGIYAQVNLTATTLTTVYTTVPTAATYNIRFCNRNSTSVAVRLAIGAAATPDNSEYIEYDAVIPGNGILEEQGIPIQASKLIVAYSSVASVSVAVWGVQ
jgi:hypothetical protein